MVRLLLLRLFVFATLTGIAQAQPVQPVWPMCGNPPAPCTPSNPVPTSSGGAPPAGSGIANQASADSVSNLVFVAPRKQLESLTVKIGATSGYVMVFDLASLPSNGAVTPKSGVTFGM